MRQVLAVLTSIALCSSSALSQDAPKQITAGTELIAAAPFTHFSRKSAVKKTSQYVYGMWADSIAAACNMPFKNSIPAGAVIEMRVGGKCPDGEAVIMCIHN